MCPRFLVRSDVNIILNMTDLSGNVKDISTSSYICSSLNTVGRYFLQIMKEKRKERKGKKLDNEPREEKRGIAMQIAFKPVLSGSARGTVG